MPRSNNALSGTLAAASLQKVAIQVPTSPGITGTEPAKGGSIALAGRWLDSALFFCLTVFALCAPLATKGALTAFRIALVLWLITILIDGRKIHRQPLALPLLLFLLFTGLSTVFSTEPLLSWGRMRGVTELTIAILVAQTLKNLRQIKILVGLLVFASLLSAAITAWQYTVGTGVELTASAGAATLSKLGLRSGDIIQKIEGTSVRTPRQLFGRLDSLPSDASVHLSVTRQAQLQDLNVWTGATFDHLQIAIRRKVTFENSLRQRGIGLSRARPLRAQGTLKHYFSYSELMVLIGLVVWGLMLAPRLNRAERAPLAVAFCAIAVVVVLTLTRISLAGLLLGCLLIAWKQATMRNRRWLVIAFVVALLLGVGFVQKQRGQRWVDFNDPGNQYRLLMWRDSLKFIRAHPLLGVGLDSVAGHWQRWDLEAYRRFPLKSHFHSTPIQIAVECGLPALIAWLWLMGGYFAFLTRLWQSLRGAGSFPPGLVAGILGGLAAVLLTALLQYNFGDSEAMIVFWFLMGLAFALERIARQGNVALDLAGSAAGLDGAS